MRLFWLPIVFLLSNTSILGQKTVALNKQWNVVDYKVFTPNICTDIYSFKKDTLINSIQYFELHKKSDTSMHSDWKPLKTFLREDENQRVYVIDNDKDVLLYDYSLIPGDTFNINYNHFECQLLVHSVDSIQLFSGEKRKRIRLLRSDDPDPNQPWYGYKDWIQGIGSSTSLTNYVESCFTDYPLDLLCYFEEGELVYSNPNNQGCYITPVKEVNDKIDAILFPNPTHEVLEIKTESKLINVGIFNLEGQKILESQEHRLEIDQISEGLYIVYIETTDGISIQKIIIE